MGGRHPGTSHGSRILNASYAHALRRLEGRIGAGIRPGLETTRALLARLGNPDRAMRIVQIAGTNGKGSTCRFLHRILQGAGIRTGLFTSPHLLSVRERMVLDEDAIPEDEFVDLVETVLPHAEELDATYFETLTAMGALWFAASGAQVAVMETGLGGRLDSVTALEAELCAVSQIGLDHCGILGDTIEAIWAEKIAILRPGRPLLTLETREPLRAALRDLAAERGGEAVFLDPSSARAVEGLPGGSHQQRNLALSRALAERILGRIPSDSEIERALSGMVWPGRFQRVPGDPELILDVGHNPDAAEALSVLAAPLRPVLLFGAMSDKDWQTVLGRLALVCSETHLPPLDTPRAASPEELREAWPQAHAHRDFESAWRAASARARAAGVPVLATGSFHLVGGLLRRLRAERPCAFWPAGIVPDPELPSRS